MWDEKALCSRWCIAGYRINYCVIFVSGMKRMGHSRTMKRAAIIHLFHLHLYPELKVAYNVFTHFNPSNSTLWCNQGRARMWAQVFIVHVRNSSHYRTLAVNLSVPIVGPIWTRLLECPRQEGFVSVLLPVGKCFGGNTATTFPSSSHSLSQRPSVCHPGGSHPCPSSADTTIRSELDAFRMRENWPVQVTPWRLWSEWKVLSPCILRWVCWPRWQCTQQYWCCFSNLLLSCFHFGRKASSFPLKVD